MSTRLLIAVAVAVSSVAGASVGSYADNLDNEIAKKEQEIKTEEVQLAPLVAPILITDAGVRLFMSKRIFLLAASSFNQLSDPQRTLLIDVTGQQGQLKNSNGGALGCGWFVELNDNDGHASMHLANLSATWDPQGALNAGLDYVFAFNGSLHGHVKGPAGPCPIFPSCDCPIGGGFGTTVGVTGSRQGPVTARLVLGSNATDWLLYSGALTGPGSVRIDAFISLQYVGQVRISLDFDLPAGPLFQGAAPPMFDQTGVLKIPSLPDRSYTLHAVPQAFVPDATGIAVKGRLDLTFIP